MLQSVNAGRLQDVDFMTEAELITAGSTKAALLNDVKIYVTSVAKTLDQAIADGDIGASSPTTTLGDIIFNGGGGDVRYPIGTDGQVLTSDGSVPQWENAAAGDSTNVLLNPQFEKDGADWTITGGCVASYPVTAELGKTLRLTCTAATFSVKQLSTSLVPFAGQQAAFDTQIKSDASGVKVSSISNSIRNTEYDVIGDDTFKRFKQVGVIVDAVNNGLEIFSDVAFTGVVDIDNNYLGLSNLTQEIEVISNWEDFTPTGTWTTNTTYTGKYRRVGDSVEISYHLSLSGLPNNTSLQVDMPNGLLIDTTKIAGATGVVTSIFGGGGNVLDSGTGTFHAAGRYLPSSPNKIQVSSYTGNPATWAGVTETSPMVFANGDEISLTVLLPIEGWSSASSTIATQKSLSPDYAGFLSFSFMDGDLSGHLPADGRCVAKNSYPDYDKRVANLYGDCDAGTGANTGYNLPDMRGYFPRVLDNMGTVAGAAGVDIDGTARSVGQTQSDAFKSHNHSVNVGFGGGANVFRSAGQDNGGTVSTFNSGSNGNVNETRSKNMGLMAYVRMVDNNTIIGSFEQIRSDDLITASAISLSGATSSASFAYNFVNSITEVEDVNNIIQDNGDIEIVISKTSKYTIDFSYQHTISLASNGSTFACGLQRDTGSGYTDYKSENLYQSSSSGTTFSKCVFTNLVLNVGDKLKMYYRKQGGGTVSWAGDARVNYLEISELPTTQSIVANILANSGMIEKCQTKILSADVAAIGVIADLTFNNLDITKKYKATLHSYQAAGSVTSIRNNGNRLANAYSQTGEFISETGTPVFQPTSTTLEVYSFNATAIYGNGTLYETRMELCQKPDTTLLTSEFN